MKRKEVSRCVRFGNPTLSILLKLHAANRICITTRLVYRSFRGMRKRKSLVRVIAILLQGLYTCSKVGLVKR